VTDVATVEASIADTHRREWARVLAATVRVARDLDLAEECVQEAYAAALEAWVGDGIPGNPVAWLTITAKRRAIDAIRRERALRSRLPLLVEPEDAAGEVTMQESMTQDAEDPDNVIPDERLRLIFTCCHPALAQEAQVALTLRLLCGVPTADIARAFLVSEPTVAARVTRAKKEDLRRADPPPGPPARRVARSAACCARRDPPAVHYRPHGTIGHITGARRTGGPGNAPCPDAARADARRYRGVRAVCAAAGYRCAARDPRRRRRPTSATKGTGPVAMGPVRAC
jgi:RNA polymerase sigma factor (sigma-70 family)